MFLVTLYWATLALSCLYVAWAGGIAERSCALAVAIASIASTQAISPFAVRYENFEWRVFVVDACLLVALIAIVIRSKRYWPLWAAGFQVVDLLTHTAILTGASRRAYALALGFWAYGILACVVAGAFRSRHCPAVRVRQPYRNLT